MGRDFLVKNRLVETYSGCFLTQIQTDQLIPAVDNKKQQASHVKQVQNNLHMNSKLQPHGVENIIKMGYARLVRHCVQEKTSGC